MDREKLINKLSEQVLAEFDKYSIKPKLKSANISINKQSISTIKKEFGTEKEIPKEFEAHILYALSFYPELKNVKISFKIKNALFLMETKLKPLSIFSKKRQYVIVINKKRTKELQDCFSVIGLGGLICHELSHVLDYERKSAFGMIKFILKYLFPKSRRNIELSNDLRTFYHGTGHAMIVYEKEYLKSPFSAKAKKYHDSFYLRKKELEALMKKKIKNK